MSAHVMDSSAAGGLFGNVAWLFRTTNHDSDTRVTFWNAHNTFSENAKGYTRPL